MNTPIPDKWAGHKSDRILKNAQGDTWELIYWDKPISNYQDSRVSLNGRSLLACLTSHTTGNWTYFELDGVPFACKTHLDSIRSKFTMDLTGWVKPTHVMARNDKMRPL
ncbi:hypothetical protein QTI24_26675 [Variovorax sp. J22P240]|uniref:hypothetical protein n=1 Tax=Variovorax sp. J22P240 TaxID=3053514 RepID=UPI002576DD29|nr:hypothetical protein [Variovorax sp. J22P240]MDM0002218.1 hypothetical protein [Variovorax sp. J22P240]